jgi:hypothetical protein
MSKPRASPSPSHFATDDQLDCIIKPSLGLSLGWHTLTVTYIPTNTTGISLFKAGRGWCDRFKCREGLSLRHGTCQKILVDLQGKLFNVQRYVIQLRKKQK